MFFWSYKIAYVYNSNQNKRCKETLGCTRVFFFVSLYQNETENQTASHLLIIYLFTNCVKVFLYLLRYIQGIKKYKPHFRGFHLLILMTTNVASNVSDTLKQKCCIFFLLNFFHYFR